MSDQSQSVTSPNRKTDLLASAPGNEVENLQMDPHAQAVLNLSTTELEVNEFWPLSGKPFFHLILSKSHVKPSYQLVIIPLVDSYDSNQVVPAKIYPVLPCATVPLVLIYQGKCWKANYIGNRGSHKRFDTNWKTFAIDNDLKVGDACVFELTECSSSTNIKFRVQILRGDFPSELLSRVNGETSNTPIVID